MQWLWSVKLSEKGNMTTHLNTFWELANQVRALSSDGKGVPDSDLVSIICLSLPPSYQPLIMALQSRSEVSTSDFLSGRLLQESSRRQAAGEMSKSKDTNTTESAFTVGTGTF